MKPISSAALKNSMLTGLIVTALLTPQGGGYASAAQGGQANAFIDVQSVSADRLQSIQKALSLGLIEGDENGSFRPDDKLTRQELATLLTRALQLPIPSSLDSFQDVAATDWSSPYIAAVKKAGIMVGDDQGNFHPTDYITREEIAVTLVRASEQALEVDAAPSAVNDWNDVSSWAKAFVQNAIQQGIMPINQGNFQPSEQVLRADVAQMLISAFFPTERASLLEDMQDNHVRINGINYELSPEVKGILQDSNRDILKGAKLKFRFTGRTLQAITELQLNASGDPAKEGNAEFSGNLVLDGHGAVVDGDVKVGGDYTTVKNLTVNGDFHITKDLQNDFYASKLTVKGNTNIEGGDSNTVVFDDSSLQNVDVSKDEVHIVSQSGTSISSMNVTSNAAITADSSTIQQVTIADGANSVELQGTIPQVTVTSTQSVIVTGNSTIDNLTVNSGTQVNLAGSGSVANLEVNNSSATVIVGTGTSVSNVAAASDVPASAVKMSATSGETNTSPTVVAPIAEQKMTVGDPNITIDLSKYFRDSEQSTLKYTAVSLSSKIAKASVSGNILTLSAVGRGSTTVKLIIDDQNGGKINAEFKVTINAYPVVSQAVTPMVITLGQGDKAVDITSVFKDDDGDALTYTVASSDLAVATVVENTGQLTLSPVKSGTTTITLSASDGKGGFGTTSFEVAVNQPPAISNIPDKFVQMAQGPQVYDLTSTSYLSDLENDALTLTAESSHNDVATVTVNDKKLIFTPVAVGETEISLTVSDGRGGSAQKTFKVIVNTVPNVKQAPSDKELTEGKTDSSLDLSQVFEDADHDTLTYEVTSSQPTVASVEENGGKVTVHALSFGTAEITVKAMDSRGGVVSTVFTFKVNQAPTIDPVPAQIAQVGGDTLELDLSPYVKDREQDAWTVVSATTDNPLTATVQAAGQKLRLSALSKGKTIVHFQVKDAKDGVREAQFELTANAVPQVVQPLQARTLTVGTAYEPLDLSSVFTDGDQDALTYEVKSSNPLLVTPSVSAAQLSLTPLKSGDAQITVTAKDGKGGEKSTSFTVTVNEAPVISPIADKTVQLGQGIQNLDLGTYLSDVDNTVLTLTADTADHSVATVTVTGTTLHVTPLKAGVTQVNVTVSDGRGGDTTGVLSLLVNTVPTVQQSISPMLLTKGLADQTLDLTNFFADGDQDALTYEVTSTVGGVADLSETGGQLTVKAVQSGTTTVNVKAKDGKGGEVTATFAVTVNEAPVVQTISETYVQLGQGAQEIDLTPYLTDKEGDSLTVTAEAVDSSIAAIAGVQGLKLSVTPVQAGNTDVKITVSDGRGGVTEAVFVLKVNAVPVVVQPINDMVVTVNQAPGVIQLAPTFSDADQDALTYEVQVDNPAKASAEVNGGTLSVQGLQAGLATVTVKAKDGKGGVATTVFHVDVNQPPVITSIPEKYVQFNGGPVEWDLASYISDPENDNIDIQASSNDSSVVTVSNQGSKLTLTPVDKGVAQIKIVATDARNGVTEKTINVHVNVPPTVVQQPNDVTLTVGAQDHVVNLADVFNDADVSDNLTYEATSSSTSTATVSEQAGQLTVHPLASGNTTITVKASDGHGGEVTASFAVTVNEAPKVSSIPVQRLILPGASQVLDLASFLTDKENDTLTVTAESEDASTVKAELQGTQLTLTPIALGQTNVKLMVSDGRGGSTNATVVVKVTPPNEDPTIAALEDQSLQVGQTAELDLTSKLADADNDPLTVTAVSDNTGIATVSVSGKKLTFTPKAVGQTQVTVTVSDGRGGEATGKVTLNVTKANAAPTVVAMIAEQVLTPGVTNPRSYDLSQLFEDADGDALSFTAVSSSEIGAKATVSGSTITLEAGTGTGTSTVTITADDGHGGTATYSLTVRTAPSALSTGVYVIHTKSGVSDAISYDLSTVFPGQTSFNVYLGTADSTFVGPTPLTGTSFTPTQAGMYYWIVGADGKAVIVQLVSDQQIAGDKFYISQYLDAGDGRIAIEMYNQNVVDLTGYSFDVSRYNKQTKAFETVSVPLVKAVAGMTHIVINSTFYDFFDIINAQYYNEDAYFYDPTKYNIVGYTLKKNGQVVDVLGDPTSTNAFMPNGGTIIRKRGIYSGSKTFALEGEWNVFPKGTLQYFSHHTP